MKISGASVDARSLEYLLNKVLNGAYLVKSMKITKNDSQKAAVEMEIEL